jgi:hypothetical protein
VTVVAARQSGSVLVKRGNAFVPLGDAEAIPVGATVDARKGVVALAAAGDASATIAAGIFRVKQARTLGATTDLVLVTPPGRARACASRATRRAKGVVRRLRVRVAKGVFRTIGKRSVSKGRNASWVTADGCGGTRTTVSRGKVKVRTARRTRVVKAGESFIARARLFGAKTRRR